MRRILRIIGLVLAVLLVLLLGLVIYIQVTWDRPDGRAAPRMTAPRDSAAIARGEHIFKDTWQCWGCHASPATDGNALPSGGMKFDLRNTGPGFGVYYSRNLTPDSATGLGGWTDGEIVQAIREGVRKDRHVLFPLMPVDWLKGLSDQDVLAVVAYLRSLPPVTKQTPDNEPSFFAKALLALHIIKPLAAIDAPVGAPPPAPTAAYGRYFATAMAGCAECHTPRNLQNGEFYMDSIFTGSTFAFGADQGDALRAYARNIRPEDTDGIGLWNIEEFVGAVTSGLRPDSTVLAPHMPYSHYKFLSEEEVKAVYLFLKSLEPMKRTVPAPEYSAHLRDQPRGETRGRLLYISHCQPCHGVEGTGARPTNVSLAEVAPSLNDGELMEFIAAGQPNLKMPPFGKTLSSEDLSDIVGYIRSWKGR